MAPTDLATLARSASSICGDINESSHSKNAMTASEKQPETRNMTGPIWCTMTGRKKMKNEKSTEVERDLKREARIEPRESFVAQKEERKRNDEHPASEESRASAIERQVARKKSAEGKLHHDRYQRCPTAYA